MKFILSFLFVGISLCLFAQDSQPINFLKLQGGLVYDSRSSKDYTGFSYLNIGWSRLKNEKINGLELELMAYDQTIERQVTSTPGTVPSFADWTCNRQAIELSYFQTYSLVNDVKNGIYAGPFLSASFVANQINPKEGTLGFPLTSNCFCLGLGAKVDYYVQVSDKIYFTLGTKLNIISTGIYQDQISNPALTRDQQTFTTFEGGILEGKVPLMLGFSLTI